MHLSSLLNFKYQCIKQSHLGTMNVLLETCNDHSLLLKSICQMLLAFQCSCRHYNVFSACMHACMHACMCTSWVFRLGCLTKGLQIAPCTASECSRKLALHWIKSIFLMSGQLLRDMLASSRSDRDSQDTGEATLLRPNSLWCKRLQSTGAALQSKQ